MAEDVAPLVGVWIEIADPVDLTTSISVAPLVGVWIEIKTKDEIRTRNVCRYPSWECGLKSILLEAAIGIITSLPSWECGLKYYAHYKEVTYETSLPSWECGLKYLYRTKLDTARLVAPLVGV